MFLVNQYAGLTSVNRANGQILKNRCVVYKSSVHLYRFLIG